MRARLGKLPKDLKAAYDEIYSAIKSQDGDEPGIADRAFQWIICSYRPLRAVELVAAIRYYPESDSPWGTYPDIDIHFVLDACRNLLVVDEKLGKCRFAHLSVQEYFEE